MNYYVGNQAFSSERDISHHGVLGMKWGVRRYQNKDGSYKKGADGRYAESNTRHSAAGAGHRAMAKVYSLNEKTYNKTGNKTMASMNRHAKNEALKKADAADAKAQERKIDRINKKYDKKLAKDLHKVSGQIKTATRARDEYLNSTIKAKNLKTGKEGTFVNVGKENAFIRENNLAIDAVSKLERKYGTVAEIRSETLSDGKSRTRVAIDGLEMIVDPYHRNSSK